LVNTLLQIVKISATTGTGITSDHTITPNLTNVDRAFAFVFFRPLDNQNHDSDWKAYEILNTSTLRIHGDTAGNAVPFVAYIIEFDTASDIRTQLGTLGNVQGGTGPPYNSATTPATSTLTALTLAESMEWMQGHAQAGTDTTIGTEELEAVRILTTTTWEYDIQTNPNSVQNINYAGFVDWNDAGVVVQRGVAVMGATATTETLVSGTDFTAVADTARTMLLCSSVNNEGNFSVPTDENAMNMEFNGADIDFTRQAQGGFTNTIHWVIIEFPLGFATVQHLVHTMGSGDATNSDTITALVDFNNAFPIGTASSGYFSYGGARPSAAQVLPGLIDQVMVSMDLTSNTNVNFARDVSGTALRITYQVVEFLAGGIKRYVPPLNTSLRI